MVLDTNILISAIGWDGPEREILRKGINDEFTILTSQDILNEFYNVLARNRFKFIKRTDIGRFSIIMMETFEIVETRTRVNLIEEDPDDNMVIECALDGKADRIISGDMHLLKFGKVGDIRIMSSRDLLEEL